MKLPVQKDKKLTPITMPEILEAQTKGMISTSEGFELLEKLLRETFPQDRIKELINELCKAEDIKMSKAGKYTTPNWRARREGLDRVIDLLNYTKTVDAVGRSLPTKVVFNTIIVGAKDGKIKK